MIICPKCSAECPDGQAFCTSCGAPLSGIRNEQPQQNPYQQPAQNQYQQPEQNPYQQPQQNPYQQPQQNPYQQPAQNQYQQPAQNQYQQSAQNQYQQPQQNQYQQPQQNQYQQPAQNQYQQPQQNPYEQNNGYAYGPVKTYSFGDAIKLFFKKYATFSGRATRSEYWYVFLLNSIIGGTLGFLAGLIYGKSTFNPLTIVTSLYSLAVAVPGLAVCVRRLHDIGKSGTAVFWNLLPIAGPFIFLYFVAKESDGDNEYGMRKVEGMPDEV